ncbi:OmpA family protein [Prevotella sp. OH937_COT-195]|uniref:OmpA family protein n=1 Tax=Prevotella sp. OH937_COT-195 TaxID=2491051 RepID=UPI0013153F39|nr:OmpA family protein [Prevotella sp. OH937_COT-195]
MKKLLLSAVLFLLGMTASFAQVSVNTGPEYLNRHWQFSLHGGYDFGLNHGNSYRYLDFKGGPNIGIGVDHYWSWFGLGLDGDYITNKPEIDVDGVVPNGLKHQVKFEESVNNVERIFLGAGPSFRLPATILPPFMAELNLRAGMVSINGGKSSLKEKFDEGSMGRTLYAASDIDSKTRLAMKAQMRFSYFFNEWFGLSLGGYYMHCFNVPYSDYFYKPIIINSPRKMADLEPDNVGKTDMSSLGMFCGVVFRLNAKKVAPKPPVVVPTPKPMPTEFTLKGRVTICGTTEPAVGAKVVIKSGRGKKMYEFTTDSRGEYSVSLRADTRYTINITKKECLPAEEFIIEKNQYNPVKTTLVTVDHCLTKPKLNEPIRLNNIHYDFDKATIRPDARPELDRLVAYLLDNPNIRVEMSSHTDSRGSDSYNLRLSQQRANSVKAYLVEHGISSSRIVSVGYGETRLLNRCSNGVPCSEAEHQLNRRTEMKVIE